MSVFRFQDLAPQLPDTPGPDLTLYGSGIYDNIGISCSELWESVISHQGGPKPDTWHHESALLNSQRPGCPAGAIFSERSLRKSLVPIYWNHIMFAHDLCHCHIEYFRNAIDLNWKDRANRYNKSSIFNFQFRLVRVRRLLYNVGIIW